MIGCGIVRASKFMFIPAGLDVDVDVEVSQRNAAHARSARHLCACAQPLPSSPSLDHARPDCDSK